MTARELWRLVRQALAAWVDDYAPSMGAALSYYTLFSIAPLLMIVIAVAGIFFGPDAVRGELFSELSGLVGREGARAIEQMLETASAPKEGATAAAVSFVALVIGATTVLGELQNALDRIWRAPALKKKSGLRGLARSRLHARSMILGFGFLLMVSLALSAALAALGKWWGSWFRGWELLAHALDLVLSFGFTTVLFALIYKIIPRVHIRWHDVWVGAAVTALLFSIGKILIGLYLGKSQIASGFGAAGSLVLVMVWVYYSAQIFLIGAEFTWVYAHEHGSRRGVSAPPTAASCGERTEGNPASTP